MAFGMALITWTQYSTIFVCMRPFWHADKRINDNQVILQQACSCSVRRQSFAISCTSQTGLVYDLGEIQIFNQSIFHDSVCDFQFTIICISINGDDKSGNLLGEHVLLAAPLDGYHHLQE